MKRLSLLLVVVLLSLNSLSQNGYWFDSTWVELTPIENEIILNNHNGQSKDFTNPIIACSDNAVKSMDSLMVYKVYLRQTSYCDTIVILPRIITKVKDQEIVNQIIELFANRLYVDNCVTNSIYEFRCSVNSDVDVLKLVDRISRISGVEWCEPDMMFNLHYFNNLYPLQYYLYNTGQNGGTPGIDINAEAAWQITAGNPLITVAVIDSGVDSTHIDLAPNVLQGYTVGDSNGHGAPVITDIGYEHGTACAGIIGALDNEIGIHGIASGVKLLPVNLHLTTSNSAIANAIRWAYNRADVLCCSFGDISYNQDIKNAIIEATTDGRNGKGCVVVFASGNRLYDHTIRFPANVANCITVGAIKNNGQIWGYSCRGDSLDLVTPSGDCIYGDVVTTDISGSNGYSPNDYCYDFGGTSAAAPQVVGVAALMLSINPTLTQHRVREILRETATDLGNAQWDRVYGYGLVNAGLAVSIAKTELPAFTTSKTYNGENEMTITVSAANNIFSNYFTTEWTVLTGNMTISSIGSNYCTLTKSTSGLPAGVVMMKVKFGDKVLYTTVVGLNVSDIAKYKQNTCTYYGVTHPEIPLTVINSGGQAHVHQGCRVYLYNDAFGLYQHYGNISHSGVTPDDWYVGNNNVQFSLPLGSGGIPFGVQVRDDSGTLKYQYIFFSYSGNGNSSIRVNTISSSEYEISLCEDEDNQIVSQSNDDALSAYGNSEQTWRLEIYNTWDASKVYDQEIIGDKAILDTSGWRVGTYAIRAIRGDQVYTEKMLVK